MFKRRIGTDPYRVTVDHSMIAQPPNGTYHDVDAFFTHFRELWHDLRSRFFKWESWQSYREPGDPSYEALVQGDFDEASRLLRERVLTQAELLNTATARGVQIVRVRPVNRPISDYLKYEFEAYRATIQMGEEVRILDGSEAPWGLSAVPPRDFLLFDDYGMLVHDYDETGLIQGGWVVQDAAEIANATKIADHLVTVSEDFSSWESRL